MINSIVKFFHNMRCTDNEIIAREILEDMVRSEISSNYSDQMARGRSLHVNNLQVMIKKLASALDQTTNSNINQFDEVIRKKLVTPSNDTRCVI